MHRRFIGLVAALAAAAIATTACSSGGGQLSHDDYQKKITQIAADFKARQQDSLGSLQKINSPDDLPKVADSLRTGADQIDQVADDLDGINPPDDAADANSKLVSGFRATADALRQLADAAEKKDLQKLQEIGTSFQNSEASKQLNQAEQELKKAGYNVPNTGS